MNEIASEADGDEISLMVNGEMFNDSSKILGSHVPPGGNSGIIKISDGNVSQGSYSVQALQTKERGGHRGWPEVVD